MKPAYDKLGEEYKDSSSVVIGAHPSPDTTSSRTTHARARDADGTASRKSPHLPSPSPAP